MKRTLTLLLLAVCAIVVCAKEPQQPTSYNYQRGVEAVNNGDNEEGEMYLLEELTEEKRKMEKDIQDMAKRAEILTEDEQLQYENIRDYYLFLYKLHAEIMIREERYELAYNDLDYLLQYEQTQEYAQAKIDELDKINPNSQ